MRENETHAGEAGACAACVSRSAPSADGCCGTEPRAYLLTVSASAMSSFRFVGMGFVAEQPAIQTRLWAR